MYKLTPEIIDHLNIKVCQHGTIGDIYIKGIHICQVITTETFNGEDYILSQFYFRYLNNIPYFIEVVRSRFCESNHKHNLILALQEVITKKIPIVQNEYLIRTKTFSSDEIKQLIQELPKYNPMVILDEDDDFSSLITEIEQLKVELKEQDSLIKALQEGLDKANTENDYKNQAIDKLLESCKSWRDLYHEHRTYWHNSIKELKQQITYWQNKFYNK